MATLNLSKMKYMSETNLKKFANLIISLSSQVTDVENKCIKPYVANEIYQKDSYVSYNGYIYQATATNQDSAFNETHWDKLSDDFNELTVADIESMLGLSSEQLETMANLIADTEVRLDKTYSSSKIYQDIQQCLNDSKTFTLLELGKFSGVSYKIVASTSEMTSESIIYLLANGNTYDMYIVEENGATTKIGDTNVNLSDYYTKTEIEADYLKKVDADGKYATITTVNGKIDKDKIVTVLDDTVTDGEVASAKAVYDELQEVFQSVTNNEEDITDLQEDLTNINTKLSQLETKAVLIPVASDNPSTSYDLNDYIENGNYSIGNPSAYTNMPELTCGLLTVFRAHNYRLQLYTSVQNDNIYFRKSDTWGDTWSSWEKVCTTKVADVPFTKLTVNNWASGNVEYTVKNGICYLWICGIESSTMSQNSQIIVGNLPVPKRGGLWCNIVSSDCTKGGLLVRVTSDGNLTNYSGLNNVQYYGTFSYPVAE